MKKQASGRDCFVCGVNNHFGLHMKFYESEPGTTHAEIIVPVQFQGYPGIVHGGIIAAMLDEISARAFLGDGSPRFLVTVKLSVRYRKPVPVGVPLTLRGRAGHDNGRAAYATGEIFDDQGILLAEAETVLADLPPEVSHEPPDGDDWRVYPD